MTGQVAKRSPLPWWQLTIVYAIQLAEPITGTVIYPFLPEFVRKTGITEGDDAKTGYYSGIIGSVFFAAECLTVYHWGRASDVYGRRPVLLLGPLGLAFAMLFFGLTSNFWLLVFLRAMQGVFNGNLGVAKTIVAELSDSTNIGDAFAVMPLVWGLGNAVGPVMGGLLADPAKRWPDSLGKLSVLHDYPYLLPCGTAAIFAFIIFLSATVSLKETHPTLKVRSGKINNLPTERTGLLDGVDVTTSSSSPNEHAVTAPPTVWEVLNPGVISCIINNCACSFVGMGFTVLMPLMWSTSIPLGGLGFSPDKIGAILATYGFINSSLQVLFLGRVLRRFGPRRVYIGSMVSMFVGSLAFAAQSTVARHAGHVTPLVWALIAIHLAATVAIYAAIGAIQVAVVQNVTSSSALGATNGLMQMAGSGIRGLSPWLCSAMFSATIERDLAGGFLVYIVMSTLLLVSIGLGTLIPKDKAVE
ncbi:MFS general substrate transporter [Cylindrobasidium torrendii FP15055 ss-10]|uniref:MFS general substrate transporter n=1 Tax=Cylindrobasidium torrendii FP15055 ss-10 TaxID=1314674 RepID=A0A0D7AV10_9AGAR|nr:MFS general substrate transporter [Cylindrobasidium torrendii FP15055 ss-10]